MWIKSFINYAFFREFRYKRVVRRHLNKFYAPTNPVTSSDEQMVVCMADGRYLHGGLADRLRSFTTFYGFCKSNGIRFAINFTFPFPLEKYLIPNEYDWCLRPGELTFNSQQAHAVYMDNPPYGGEMEMKFQRRITEKFLKRDRFLQHHVYSSFYYGESEFGRNFRELFRPADYLQSQLDSHMNAIGGKYISVSTRFLELLGDFKEPKGGIRLSAKEIHELIGKCITQIQLLHDKYPDYKVLVTSDSISFLKAASPLPYVYIVDGDILHVDIAGDSDHSKTFLDFLLIGNAEKAFQLQTGPMYGGNFSMRASQANDRPFERIKF